MHRIWLRIKHAWNGHPYAAVEYRGPWRRHCRECGRSGTDHWATSHVDQETKMGMRVGETRPEFSARMQAQMQAEARAGLHRVAVAKF